MPDPQRIAVQPSGALLRSDGGKIKRGCGCCDEPPPVDCVWLRALRCERPSLCDPPLPDDFIIVCNKILGKQAPGGGGTIEVGKVIGFRGCWFLTSQEWRPTDPEPKESITENIPDSLRVFDDCATCYGTCYETPICPCTRPCTFIDGNTAAYWWRAIVPSYPPHNACRSEWDGTKFVCVDPPAFNFTIEASTVVRQGCTLSTPPVDPLTFSGSRFAGFLTINHRYHIKPAGGGLTEDITQCAQAAIDFHEAAQSCIMSVSSRGTAGIDHNPSWYEPAVRGITPMLGNMTMRIGSCAGRCVLFGNGDNGAQLVMNRGGGVNLLVPAARGRACVFLPGERGPCGQGLKFGPTSAITTLREGCAGCGSIPDAADILEFL